MVISVRNKPRNTNSAVSVFTNQDELAVVVLQISQHVASFQLTEGPCKPLRLVIVDDGHAQRIEAHQTQNHPVETLGFHHAADEEAGPLLLTAKVGGTVHLAAAFHTCPTKRRAWRSCE